MRADCPLACSWAGLSVIALIAKDWAGFSATALGAAG
jgi:hypothetical protein